ncbi:MAG TPA: molybdenum cofactor biosynthesis protein MoaE [Terriglobia bacterium]|nr:molybdenum cofactor biosynthesis protein MoaE [Terriglobia bacterium]
MRIRVLFFGVLREIIGRSDEGIEVAAGSDIGSLFEEYVRRYPALQRHGNALLFSRNREFARRDQRLEEGDEVAFLPPVSGGAPGAAVRESAPVGLVCRLTREPIPTQALVRELQQREDGAVVVFEGVVRNHSQGRQTLFLDYEAYEPMALEKMRQICQELARSFPIDRIGIIHRLGRLEIGDASVVIVVTAEHRKAAFDACREAIDRLKRTVPIWKKEFFADGAVWVEGEEGITPR